MQLISELYGPLNKIFNFAFALLLCVERLSEKKYVLSKSRLS